MSVLEILRVWPLLKVFFEGIASVNWGDRGDGGFIYGTLSILTVHFGGCCRYTWNLGPSDRYGVDRAGQSCNSVCIGTYTTGAETWGYCLFTNLALMQIRP